MHDSLVAVDPVSNDPRYRSLAYRSMPALSCPYLTMSAVAMAMLDGILRKLAPPTEVKSSSESAAGKSKSQLAEQLAEDTSFLMHGEVFSERLIAVLCKQLVHSTV
jgi:glutamine synthetase